MKNQLISLLVTTLLGLATISAHAGNTWHGTITAVENSSQTEITGVANNFAVGNSIGAGVASLAGGGVVTSAIAGIFGGSIGSNFSRERQLEEVKCVKLSFKLDDGEEGDLCLSGWDMKPAFVVGARIVVKANDGRKMDVVLE
jgi:hypothetical protein